MGRRVGARRGSAHRMPQLSIIVQSFICIHFKDSVNSVRYFLLLAAYRRIGVRRLQNRSTPHCKAIFKVSEAFRLCSPTRVSEVSRLCSHGVSTFFGLPAGARP